MPRLDRLLPGHPCCLTNPAYALLLEQQAAEEVCALLAIVD
jgi:hypothetical protein